MHVVKYLLYMYDQILSLWMHFTQAIMNVLSLILNAHIKNLFYKLNVHGGKKIYINCTCKQTPF